MKEVFVIERCLAPGLWEIFGTTAYKNEKDSLDFCLDTMKKIEKIDPEFVLRPTKLEIK